MPSILAASRSGNSYLDSLLYGYYWSGPLTYSTPSSYIYYPANYDGYTVTGFQQVSTQQQQAIQQILEGSGYVIGGPRDLMTSFESVTNLNLSNVGSASQADLMIGQSTSLAGPTGTFPSGTAYTLLPQPEKPTVAGDTWFDTTDFRNPIPGNKAWFSHIHELGHELGLKHPSDNGGEFGVVMPTSRDSVEFTVMSYRGYPSAPLDSADYSNAADSFPQTLMMYDIAALQYLYGANFTANSGNTTYSWSFNGTSYVDGKIAIDPVKAQSGFGKIFETIWDGGGIDTYNMSNDPYGATIDLTPGWWSKLGGAQWNADLGNGNTAQGNVYNALQYNGDSRSLIENAIGGTGNDHIYGNVADNVLAGGQINTNSQGPVSLVRWTDEYHHAVPSDEQSPMRIVNGTIYYEVDNGFTISWAPYASGEDIPGTGTWSANSKVADLDGDGLDDIVDVKSDGTIQYAGKDNTGYSLHNHSGIWGTGATPDDQIVNVNLDDNNAEFVQFYSGRIYVGRSTGDGIVHWSQWGSGGTNSDKLIDLSGDGRADLLQFYGGKEYVALSNNTSFGAWSVWGSGATATDQFVDVNNDGKRDILQIYNNREYIALSNGSSFSAWSVWGIGATLADKLADLNGDGKADVLQIYNGKAYVAYSTGTTFGPWTVKATGVQDDAFLMRADGAPDSGSDKYLDLVQFTKGETWVARGTSTGFAAFEKMTTLNTDGNDVLTGGPGHDTFVFNVGWGNDTITDFEAGGIDTIQIAKAISPNFADVVTHATQSGSDVLLNFDNNHSITIQNLHLNQLAANEFLFV